ncbi:MAG: transposase [Phototrophicales bacterium]|nr:transposase [Phototrophicales bacterium]
MLNAVEVRKTYKYRLYRNNKVDGSLHHQINVAGIIWNHALALQRRYYKLTGKYIPLDVMKKHIAKLRMRWSQYAYWKDLGSQAVQEILERLDKAYARFFKKQGGLPHFKKVKKFKSFILKQAGWDLLDKQDGKKYRKIRIGKKIYKFVNHRPLNGEIKTVAIKRDATGRLCFSVIEKIVIPEGISTGKIGGFDFGLTNFLTTDEGATIESPQYYKCDLPRLRAIQSRVSRKVKGSNNQKAGMWHTNRRHIRIADNRLEFHFQLAHDLCDQYDVMVFEDLNLDAMKRLWGRKISDLGFAQFVKVLDWGAFKRGKQVVKINRWERTTGKCSRCGHTQKLDLSDRVFQCEGCGHTLGRDHNAAINILEAGHRLMLSQSTEVLATSEAVGVNGRSPCL